MFPVTTGSIMLHSCNVRFTVNASFHGKTIQVRLKPVTPEGIRDFQMLPNVLSAQTPLRRSEEEIQMGSSPVRKRPATETVASMVHVSSQGLRAGSGV